MKTVRFFLVLGLLAAVFTNCKKDSDNDFEGLRVTINGTEWTAPLVTGAAQAGFLSIIGTDNTGSQSLSILVSADIVAGTYDLGSASVSVIVSYSKGGTATYSPKSGKLVIREHAGKRIKGTIEFVGEDLFNGGTATLTDGEFNVAYQ